MKKTTSPWTIIGWIVVVLIFVPCLGFGAIVGITALGKSSTTTTTRIGGPSGTSAPSAQDAASVADASAPAPIGTEVSPAKGWTVRVDSAELNANATIAALDKYDTPETGKQFVLVKVTITNRSNKPESAGSNLQISLLSGGVTVHESYSCLSHATDALDTSAQFQPGATVQGRLCFTATPAQAASAVLLAEPTFTVDKVKDQRFLALK